MNPAKGIKLAFVTALISGVSIFVNKFAISSISSPLVFTAIKNTLVGLFIISLLIATKKWRQLTTLTKSDWTKLISIGLIGGSLPFYLFFAGLSQIPAVNAALIHKTLVIWVAFLAIPFLKEKLNLTQIFAVAILFLSNLFVGGFNGFSFSTGELMVLGATLLWAVENIIAKQILRHLSPELVTAARMGFGSIILLIAAVSTGSLSLSAISALKPLQIFWILATAISLLAYVFTWYQALQAAPAITVTSILVVSTLVTNLLSAIFITHSWTLTSSYQALFTIAGIILFIKGASLKSNSPALA